MAIYTATIAGYKQTDTTWKDLPLYNSNNVSDGTIGAIGCAFCCACMCVKQTPKVVYNAGYKSSTTNWSGIASKYSKTYASGTATMAGVIDLLKKGRPAIVKVKSNTHWVVVYKFDGTETSPAASNFTCFDPQNGDVKLDKAYGYGGIYNVLTIY